MATDEYWDDSAILKAFDDAVWSHETVQGHKVTRKPEDSTYKEFLGRLESLEDTQTEAAKQTERQFFQTRTQTQQDMMPSDENGYAPEETEPYTPEETGEEGEEYEVGDYVFHQGQYLDPPKRKRGSTKKKSQTAMERQGVPQQQYPQAYYPQPPNVQGLYQGHPPNTYGATVYGAAPAPQPWGQHQPMYYPPPPTQPVAPSPPVPSRPSLHGKLDPEKDPELANLLMSWYWCGYYSGRFEAMQEASQEQA
eukprot:gb/GECG01014204.1/.p1 GENE.gb/GECG01014204.1/~~gb/GECG01014204.1/.p1  ORF type:complete len:251 (+),score=42.26 gb/GECG01014204.1/:1-753(+)